MVKITLDGRSRDVEDGVRLRDLAPDGAFAALANGKPVGLATSLKEDAEIRWLTFSDEEGREIFWHSSSHLLAHAVKRLFPRAKLAIGPPIEEAF
ncbi:threonine--tRNA ligase, partial [bacterium]|nr:threonine--tRNA ligase [bacterium]